MPETAKFAEIQFSDEDIVNIDDWEMWGHAYLLHDHGFVLAIVFADCESDAIDEAYDCDRLDHLVVDDELFASDYYDSDEDRVDYIGNEGARADLETLSIVELPRPTEFSWVALFNAM